MLTSELQGDKAPEDPCIKQCGEIYSDSFQLALRCRPQSARAFEPHSQLLVWPNSAKTTRG